MLQNENHRISRSNFFQKIRVVFFVLGTLFIFPPAFVSAQDTIEKILLFRSFINVNPDSSVTVTETIKVNSTGDQIKRGIYRDFPTRYKDRYGNNYVVAFNVVEVLRDGQPESYHFESLNNGVRIYIGKSDVYLSPGEYTYTLSYTTNRQLGFFKDHDELYWNVTGNGWVFPIESAEAIVQLPYGAATRAEMDGYTGPKGAKDKNFETRKDENGKNILRTTRALNSYEGFTIVVSWPKGYIREPSLREKTAYFVRDNKVIIVGFIGLLILFGYYMLVWNKVGRDPRKGTIIPLYEPPENLSPAAVRYIMKMGFDYKVFAAAVINMAVKGYLTIEEKNGTYSLIKNKDAQKSALAPEELEIERNLLGYYLGIELKNTNYKDVQEAIKDLKSSLNKNFEKFYFLTNKNYFIKGLVVSAGVLIVTAFFGSAPMLPVAIFLSVWLACWSCGVAVLLYQVFCVWRDVFMGKKAQFFPAIGLTFFSGFFVLAECIALGVLVSITSGSLLLILGGVVALNITFYHLLKAPTFRGRRLMDKIEGFKMYLSVAEKDRLNILRPIEKTPQVFEKFLPYALALNVEQAWAEQFASLLNQTGGVQQSYMPLWYSGSSWNNLTMGHFASHLSNSLSGAIASSSSAPGSSSGGGGSGGSSGGGGGGGGGGGW